MRPEIENTLRQILFPMAWLGTNIADTCCVSSLYHYYCCCCLEEENAISVIYRLLCDWILFHFN